jgi:hypothetical protein
MKGRTVCRGGVLGAGLLGLGACTSPAAPDPFGQPPEGTYQSALVPVVGEGTGGMSVTSVAHAAGIFAGTMRFRVRARPNATYFVQRAADVGRTGAGDGECQRAEGRSPWSAADPPFGSAFVTFPLPEAGDLLSFTTNGRGEGTYDYNFETPQIARGTRFDVRMRLVDDPAAPTTDLRSRCMTIDVN